MEIEILVIAVLALLDTSRFTGISYIVRLSIASLIHVAAATATAAVCVGLCRLRCYTVMGSVMLFRLVYGLPVPVWYSSHRALRCRQAKIQISGSLSKANMKER